jgi:hypothetical protein
MTSWSPAMAFQVSPIAESSIPASALLAMVRVSSSAERIPAVDFASD